MLKSHRKLASVALVGLLSVVSQPAFSSRRVSTPGVSTAWLVGGWKNGPEHGSSLLPCETDEIVVFKKDGTYRDGGSYGRYLTDGSHVIYYQRVFYDEAEGTEDRSKLGVPLDTKIKRVGPNSFQENGNIMHRCAAE